MQSEQVLVVARQKIASYLAFCPKGLIRDHETIMTLLQTIDRDAIFRDRPEAERDPLFKQIIPYVTMFNKSSVLMIRRKKKQTEERLHDRYSIGHGGHINPRERKQGYRLIEAELQRELFEELSLTPDNYSLKLCGVINDDETDVGSVHLGLWYIAETKSEEFKTQEPEKIEGEWTSQQDVLKKYDRLETWSQIVVDNLWKGPKSWSGKNA
jgi:predicted NUDIX family phosphoesterase